MNKRATPSAMAERVNAVARMLLAGHSRAEILRADPYGLGTRQMDRLLDRANAQLAEEAAQNRPALIGTAYCRYNAIYSNAMRQGDLERALKAQDRIVALFSLQAPPAPRTLNLNVDTAQLETLLSVIDRAGMSASDVFAALIEELAETTEVDDAD